MYLCENGERCGNMIQNNSHIDYFMGEIGVN